MPNASAKKTPTGVMTFSVLSVPNRRQVLAPSPFIFAEFGNRAKHPTVSAAVFDAHDTVLDWVNLSKKLEGFRALKKGWDGYNASPPGVKPLEFAAMFLEWLRRYRFLPSRLAPSVVGGVGMSFRKGGRKVYVEFSNKGTIHALFSDGVTEPIVQKIAPDLSEFPATLAKARAYLNVEASAQYEE